TDALVDALVTETSPVALRLKAWFDLHPGEPLTDADVSGMATTRVNARCLRLVLKVLSWPCVEWGGPIWTANEEQTRALRNLIDRGLFGVGLADSGWSAIASAMERAFPDIGESLDVEQTLRRLGTARGFGPGIDGRLERDLPTQMRRVARKVATY